MGQFNTRIFLLTGTILATIVGCGGSGGGSDADNGSTGDGGSVSDGGGNNSDGTGTTSGARVSAKRYDLDNNGTFEGVERYAYNPGGRLVRKEATYTGDGEPDYDFDSIVPFAVDSATETSYTEYTYNTDGNLILEVTTYPVEAEGSFGAFVQRIEKTLTWTDGLVNEVQSHFFDPTGALVTTMTEQIAYDSEGRLSTITNTTDGVEQNIVSYAYDGDSDLPASYEISETSITELTWSDDRRLTESNIYYTFTDPTEHHSRDTKTYDQSGRLVETTRTYPDSDASDDDIPYSWTVRYDGDSWKSVEERIDEQIDGAPEAVVVTEYEDGVCDTTFTFAQRATFLGGKNDTPYQPGVGYFPLNNCYND